MTTTKRGNISAQIIAHSQTSDDSIHPYTSLVTYEIVAPRFILAEINTHRMLSKNTASSRAVPVGSVLDMIETSMAKPIHWGANQPGMSSHIELVGMARELAEQMWEQAAVAAASYAESLSCKETINGHKQWVNRIIEPFTFSKTVITGTEWANFFYLRNHPDAQPEFKELAQAMLEEYQKSTPTMVAPGEWHLPYVQSEKDQSGTVTYYSGDKKLTLQEAQMVSASCCAQVSYRRLDDSLEKAIKVYERLNFNSKTDPAHASPVEHQATPIGSHNRNKQLCETDRGITHQRRDGTLWSGNLKGYIQYRQLFDNEAKW